MEYSGLEKDFAAADCVNRYKKFCEANDGNGLPRDMLWPWYRSDKSMLRWAIQPIKDKFGKDSVQGPLICDYMLTYYNDVDKDLYLELFALIFEHIDIARYSVDGDRRSFLMMILYNFDLRLLDEEKELITNEALHCYGTKTMENQDTYGNVVVAHGQGIYDIKYWILRNPNWSIDEKQHLVYELWANDEEYEEVLSQWEYELFNSNSLYVVNPEKYSIEFNPAEMYEYSYEYFLEMYNDDSIAEEVWQEVQFLKLMHILRPVKVNARKRDE